MANIQIISLLLLLSDEVRAQCTGEPLVLTVGYDTIEITSPDYNTIGYPPNTFCQWVVTSTVDGAELLFALMNMTLNCAGDAINAYNGNSTLANQLITNDCTSSLSSGQKINRPIDIANSGQLFVTFQSDSDKSADEWGFKMFIISGKSHGSCGNQTLGANGSVQYITSPGFPDQYNINSHCEYWIYPEHPDANISLDFHFVDMEYHVNCDFDYIMVNGAKYCGSDVWQPIWSSVDNIFKVTFHSDGITCKRGYILSFKQLPVDGAWSPWSSTECSVSCGGGTLNRTRMCNSPSPSPDGLRCPGNDNDEAVCNTQPCSVDGSWGQWSNFGECSVSCGGGSMNKTRICDSPLPMHGGLSCSGNESEIAICNTQHCPVDGSWGQWSNNSECSVSCGGGSLNRTRKCDSPHPMHGGLPCIGNAIEAYTCNTQCCPGANELWLPWSKWTVCSNECGEGLRTSYRDCSYIRPNREGLSCNGSSIKVKKCNVEKNCRYKNFYPVLGIAATMVSVTFFGVILVAKLCGCSLFSRSPKVDAVP